MTNGNSGESHEPLNIIDFACLHELEVREAPAATWILSHKA